MLSEKTLNYLKLSFEERLKQQEELVQNKYVYPLFDIKFARMDLETRLKTDLNFQEKLLHTKIKFLRKLLGLNENSPTGASDTILKYFSKNVFFDIKDYVPVFMDNPFSQPISHFTLLFALNANITKTQLEEIKYFCEYFDDSSVLENEYHNYLNVLNSI